MENNETEDEELDVQRELEEGVGQEWSEGQRVAAVDLMDLAERGGAGTAAAAHSQRWQHIAYATYE